MIECLIPGKNYTKQFIKLLSSNNSKFLIEKHKKSSLCGFEFLRKIIYNYTQKDIDINNIKEKLIKIYLKLNIPDTDLILDKRLVNNWQVFTYVNWLNNNRTVAEQILSKPSSEKNSEIEKQIKKETYSLTEIELFMLLKEYNIPAIVRMKGNEKSLLDANVNTFNTFDETPDEVYLIISQKAPPIKSIKRFFGLSKLDNEYKINTDKINRSLLDGVKNMNEFINNSLTFQIEKKNKETRTR